MRAGGIVVHDIDAHGSVRGIWIQDVRAVEKRAPGNPAADVHVAAARIQILIGIRLRVKRSRERENPKEHQQAAEKSSQLVKPQSCREEKLLKDFHRPMFTPSGKISML